MPVGKEGSLSAIEWIGILGSIASIISIGLNIFQASAYKALKKAFGMIMHSSGTAVETIAKESKAALEMHTYERADVLRTINGISTQAKDTIEQAKARWKA